MCVYDFIKDFQILGAGMLAIGAAFVGANALHKSTTRQIHSQNEQEKARREYEQAVFAETLLAEINDNLGRYNPFFSCSNLDDLTSALNGAYELNKDLPPPSRLVYEANVSRIGLIGKDAGACLIVAYEQLDNFYNRFKNLVRQWSPQNEEDFKGRHDWEDFEFVIIGASDGLNLAKELILKKIKKKTLKIPKKPTKPVKKLGLKK